MNKWIKDMDDQIKIHLSGHCIETGAKNEFRRLMDEYFDSNDPQAGIENRLELLREFIEKSDFKKLRASDERLSGEIETDVLIQRDVSGKITINFE